MSNQLHQQLADGFHTIYGTTAAVATRAPGRLEILGNHTDYNEGVVLSVAVDRSMYFAAAPRAGKQCRVHDLVWNEDRTFDLDNLQEKTAGDWANYIKGCVVALAKRGIAVPAFDAVLTSTIPQSAGMSSSAALEMAVITALLKMAGTTLPWAECAKAGQDCENNYVGANTGLMDQFSSLRGKAGQLVFSDFRSLEVDTVPVPNGTALVVANSMVKHNLTGAYNERRQRCEQAVDFLQTRYEGITALRDVSTEQLQACKDQMDIVTYRRAMHVVGENERVLAGVRDLENNDLTAFGNRLLLSHDSSRLNFENSCDELDILVALGQSLPGCLGARLSGGGFGGISVHLVQGDLAEEYANRLGTAFKTRTGQDPQVMICHSGDGAEILP